MAREQKWEKFGPVALLLDGGTDGKITISSTQDLHTKQILIFQSDTVQSVNIIEVKKVISRTEFLVGPKGRPIDEYQDMSSFTVADGATIRSEEQKRPNIPPHEIERAEFEEEPIVAKRVINVDELGNKYSQLNPIPVQLKDGSVNIGTVNGELEVQLSHRDNDPDSGDVADSVQVGDGKEVLRINPDGSISTADSGLDKRFDVENNIVYEGFAEPGTTEDQALWRISRTVKTEEGDLETILAGTGVFDQVWDDRASLFPVVTDIDFFNRRFEKLLPILSNANWMKLGNFDRVVPSFTQDTITMAYYEDNAIIGKAIVRYVNDLDWEMNLERYIVDDDGDLLLDDDGEPLLLD